MEEATKAVAEAAANAVTNAMVEAVLEEPGGLGEPVVIDSERIGPGSIWSSWLDSVLIWIWI